MSEHRATIEWGLGGADFGYEAYPRDHVWRFAGGIEVAASAAPGYLGNEALVDPEEAFVASLSSCHMLTFLAIASRKRIVVERYADDAVGQMEKNADGKLAITHVTLRPKIAFRDSPPDAAELHRMHEAAHRNCFIANSVRSVVEVEPA